MARTKLKTLPEGFRRRVDSSAGPRGCWPWTGLVDNRPGYDGRPYWHAGNRSRHAQKMALEATGVIVPENMVVRPTCGTAACCNPHHLAAVPPVRRQKVTDDDVREILRLRNEGVSLKKIATRKGIHFTTVSKIGSRTRRQGVTA